MKNNEDSKKDKETDIKDSKAWKAFLKSEEKWNEVYRRLAEL